VQLKVMTRKTCCILHILGCVKLFLILIYGLLPVSIGFVCDQQIQGSPTKDMFRTFSEQCFNTVGIGIY
jgi:hypothetical protein